MLPTRQALFSEEALYPDLVSEVPRTSRQPIPISDPDELEKVDRLRQRSATIPALLDRFEKVSRLRVKPGSQLAFDDQATDWFRISHAATNYLIHAADAINALHTLIPSEGEFELAYMAHFPVARSALEAASLALWILAPEDPKERVERHLRNVWREVSEEDALRDRIIKAYANDEVGVTRNVDRDRKQQKAWIKKRKDYIRTVVGRTGVPDPIAARWVVGFNEIVRDATGAVGLPAVYGEVVWRILSGVSHPSMIRAAQTMSLDEKWDNGDGTLHVLMTSDVGTVQFSLASIHR